MKDYKLTKQNANTLQQLILNADGDIQIEFNQDEGKMTVTCSEKTKRFQTLWRCFIGLFRKQSFNYKSTTFTLDEIDPKNCKLERDILIREYKIGYELGKHWDLLRWNVSKWFLGVQTVFVVGAAKGLLIMQEYCSNPEKHDLLFDGLNWLSVVNIILCLIWVARNKGIHAWHQASIKRLLLIEADPRLRNCLQHNTSILQNMRLGEGFPGANLHGTGELESWGPPLAFIILWSGVLILARTVC